MIIEDEYFDRFAYVWDENTDIWKEIINNEEE